MKLSAELETMLDLSGMESLKPPSVAVPFVKALTGNPPEGYPESRRLAIISTQHMSREDDEWVYRTLIEGTVIHGKTVAGCIFYAPDEDDKKPEEMSPELWENLRTLASMGFERIEFDSDGPVIPNLHKFDW